MCTVYCVLLAQLASSTLELGTQVVLFSAPSASYVIWVVRLAVYGVLLLATATTVFFFVYQLQNGLTVSLAEISNLVFSFLSISLVWCVSLTFFSVLEFSLSSTIPTLTVEDTDKVACKI